MLPQEMIKYLVTQVAASSSPKMLQRTQETENEVVFECDIEGIRYYVIRCRIKSSRQVSLSEREQEIARLVAQGLPNKCIGKQLSISPWTVATYLRRIFSKLGVTSRTAMITQLIEEDLLHG